MDGDILDSLDRILKAETVLCKSEALTRTGRSKREMYLEGVDAIRTIFIEVCSHITDRVLCMACQQDRYLFPRAVLHET